MKGFKYILLFVFLIYSSHMILDMPVVLSWMLSIDWLSNYVEYILPGKGSFNDKLLYGFMFRLEVKIAALLMAVTIASLVPYHSVGNKFISYLLIGFFLKETTYYLVEGNQHYSSDMLTLIFFGVLIFISIFFSKRWDRKNNIVPKKSTTIGYKCYGKPKNFLTFLAGIFNYGGTRATLYNGRLFKVNNNKKIIEIAFTKSMKDHYYFVSFSCDKSLLERGRAITGEQINMYTNNCYSVMNFIENPYKKELFSNKIKNIFKLKINNYGM